MSNVLRFVLLLFACTGQSASAACGQIPYSIQFKEAHGQLGITIPEEVKARFGQLSAATGGAFVKSSFAAVSQIAFSELLDYYQCIINEHVSADVNIPGEQKVKIAQDLRMAATALRVKAAAYFSAFAQGNGDLILAYTNDLETKTRDANGQTVPMPILRATIGKIDVMSTFQVSAAKTVWANVNVKGVSVAACGNYLKSALVANAGVIQGVASGTGAVFTDYLDGAHPDMVQVALGRLFLLASAAGTTVVPLPADAPGAATNCASASKNA